MNPHEVIEKTVRNYKDFHNPSLARLLRLSGYDTVEWDAEGAVVRDVRGREFIDCAGGYGVFALGHRHPRIIAAVKGQLDRMPLSSKVFFNKPLGDLASRLSQMTPGDLQYSFFGNSGAEVVEGALKLARLATGKHRILYALNSFHGKTLGALSVSGRDLYREPFEPLVPDCIEVPFGDISALRSAMNGDTAAVILEPIQGEGGIIIPPDDYLPRVKELCVQNGTLLIADEIQTGLGRTGSLFAVDHSRVVPDIMLLAKALGGGVMPIGAFIGTPAVWKAFLPHPLIHTSTFGGNPLACVAALETLDIIVEEDLPGKAALLGEFLMKGLRTVQEEFPDIVAEVRGRGLMIGVELCRERFGGALFPEMVRNGVIGVYTLNNPRVIRFEPPLIVERSQLEICVQAFRTACLKVKDMFIPS
ncbi:MAG: aspartate aminotransferase family protein [Armatimonadetes bacterium]|nr:aspartate aminotransferase family protein [Armatimonadota bacterium]